MHGTARPWQSCAANWLKGNEMAEMSDAELERQLRAIRLTTSGRLDARINGLAEQLQSASKADVSHAPRARRRLVTRFGRLTAATAAACMIVVLTWWFLGEHGAMLFSDTSFEFCMGANCQTKPGDTCRQSNAVGSKRIMGWVP